MVVLLILGVFVACAALGFLGMRIAANREEPNLAAGSVEQDLRAGMSPSVLGGLLGVIPFLAFVIVLVVMALQAGEERRACELREAHERGDDIVPAASEE
jgi:hypothetical protein